MINTTMLGRVLHHFSFNKCTSAPFSGRPMNFKHEIKVRKEVDGTFTGLPDEWLHVLCEQVKADRENGDAGATETGQRVLRFFQEFSRDGSRRKKPPRSPTPSSQKKRLPPLSPSCASAVFYLDLEGAQRDDEKSRSRGGGSSSSKDKAKASSQLQKSSPALSNPSEERDEALIQLTDAQKAMAETILELQKGFGQSQRRSKAPSLGKRAVTPTPAKAAPAAVKVAEQSRPPVPATLPVVKLRVSTMEKESPLTARYRNISLYDSGQALEEMRRLCNSRPIAEVYELGRKLGSGSGGTVVMGTLRGTGDKRAVKTIDLRGGEKKRHLLMEVLVMKELAHKNLVAFTDIFLSPG